MTKAIITTDTDYPKLLLRLRAILCEGKARAEAALEREKAISYWRIGESISRHLLENKDRADYGKRLFFRLAQDLNIKERLLYKIVQFYEVFPNLPARANLEWAHYRILMSIEDRQKRQLYTKQADRLRLSTRELEEAVKNDTLPQQASTQEDAFEESYASEENLIPIPIRGQLYHYRILPPDYIYSNPNQVIIDLGFYMCVKVARVGVAEAKGGEIVESVKTEEGCSFKYSNLKQNELYTYQALVDYVVDGDTLWVKIDCGLNTWIRQKLRLRGIDTPELSTPKGQKAKLFVEKALSEVPFIIIKTYKTDKYDRFLTDLFYFKSSLPKKVLEKGTYLNQQLLDLGLAKRFD